MIQIQQTLAATKLFYLFYRFGMCLLRLHLPAKQSKFTTNLNQEVGQGFLHLRNSGPYRVIVVFQSYQHRSYQDQLGELKRRTNFSI